MQTGPFILWISDYIKFTHLSKRVKGRKKHETLDAADGDKVIDEFARGLQEPKQWEVILL